MPAEPAIATAAAIVAALEREVEPLLEDWQPVEREHSGARFRFYERPLTESTRAVLVCGGIGPVAARAASQAACALYRPRVLVSTGFAGALTPQHRVGDVLVASAVIDVMHNRNYPGRGYDGVVVSSPGIAAQQEKAALQRKYAAEAVDLEAAAVAQVAEEHGTEFYAVKVISDESSARLPPFARFIEHGRFHMRRFLLYVAGRPWLWPSVARIARDSSLASQRLSQALAERLESGQWASAEGSGMRRAGRR
jgi:adenosylhomocysteine nucleosidase